MSVLRLCLFGCALLAVDASTVVDQQAQGFLAPSAVDGEDVILTLRGGSTRTGGFRVPKVAVTSAWKERFGVWTVTGEQKPLFKAFQLAEEDGALLLKAQLLQDGGGSFAYALEIVDDKHARVAGRGADLGMVLRAEPDGQLYFSGYRLVREE